MNAVNSKYDKLVQSLEDLDEAKNKQIRENAGLKGELFKSTYELKLLKKSLDDLEQYTRREGLEIRGIPLPSTPTEVNQTDYIVSQLAKKIGAPVQKSDKSASHRIPIRKQMY